MELSKKLMDALNEQLRQEYFSSYLYLSMSAYFEDKNLAGFAHWMRVQSSEEFKHAMKFYNHIIDRGSKVVLGQIDKPKTNWTSVIEAFEDAYKHEQLITNLIHKLVKESKEENDYAAEVFLDWFVEEQVEEEQQTKRILDTLTMIGDVNQALIMLDRELKKRE